MRLKIRLIVDSICFSQNLTWADAGIEGVHSRLQAEPWHRQSHGTATAMEPLQPWHRP
jgi:hypothetical protein